MKIFLVLLIAATAAASAFGVDKKAGEVKKELQKSREVVSGPLPDFKKIVSQCTRAYEERPAVYFSESHKKWAKRLSEVAISFDVKKTDSLVSPYAAYMEVTEKLMTKTADDEVSANELAISFEETPGINRLLKVNFSFGADENVWGITGATFSVKGITPTITRNREQVRADWGSIAVACSVVQR